MPGKQLTILDIAKQLNLSKSTVSRALRDSWDVNPETRRRVLELAKELDFVPSTLAMNLRQNKTMTIGVVIPSFQIPFYSAAISGIQDVASAAGYNVMTCQSNESAETEISNVNSLLKSRVDGIIISISKNCTQYDHITKLRQKGVPVVFFNRIPEDIEFPTVTVDDYQSSKMATRYLAERGCKRIAHISGPTGLKMTEDRKSGYKDCLTENNLPCNPEMIRESDFSIESGSEAAARLMELNPRPDAIFCVCDAVAFGVMSYLKSKNIRIPDDISIMGFTNEPVASLVDPPLTTVAQPVFEIGQNAAKLLLKQIDGKLDKREPKHLKLDTQLIVRGSTR